MRRIGRVFLGAAAALVAASVSASAQYNSAYDNDMACRQYADQAVAPMRDQANAQTAGSALVGAGLGTFPSVFSAFRTVGEGTFLDHAHSDLRSIFESTQIGTIFPCSAGDNSSKLKGITTMSILQIRP